MSPSTSPSAGTGGGRACRRRRLPVPRARAARSATILLTLAGLTAGIAFGGSPAAQAAAPWSAPPEVAPEFQATAVSCASSAFCVAVDATGSASIYDGSVWGPPAQIDGSNHINAVSCTSGPFCVAVDSTGNAAIYSSNAWESAGAIDSTNDLTSASCTSGTFCVAVDSTGKAVIYTGTSWSAASSIDGALDLTSVSCTSGPSCVAVDSTGNAVIYTASSWSAASSIDSALDLTSVSCISGPSCVAVDSSGDALTYDGATWTTASTIESAHDLTSVSCAAGPFCAAVDTAGNALTYNGTSWSAASSIDGTTGLKSVSCVTGSFCVAVDGTTPAAPTISGITASLEPGDTLTADATGTWSDSPVLTYQWYQCDSSGANCTAISTATAQSYVVEASDIGHTLEVSDTATVDGGSSAAAASTATPVVVPVPAQAPANASPPTIAGSAQQGQTLTEMHGSWTNSPTSYLYQWLLCDGSGNSCGVIANATAESYGLTESEIGDTVRVEETAVNGAGDSSPATSAATAAIEPAPPVDITPPSLSGTAVAGHALTESHGSWTNDPTSYAYKWEDCDSSGIDCKTITGATAQTYTLATSDVGDTVRVEEVAANVAGPGAAASSPATVVVVAPAAPSPPARPITAASLGRTIVPAGLTETLKTVTGTRGSVTIRVSAPAAGSVAIDWYDDAKSASRANATAATLVASGRRTFAGAATKPVTLAVSAAGKRLLSGPATVTLRAEATFARHGAATLRATRTFTVAHVIAAGTQLGRFAIPSAHAGPTNIVATGSGVLWFTETHSGRIARVSVGGGRITEFPIRVADAAPQGIAVSASGQVWFADAGTDAVGVIAADGAVAEYRLHASKADPTSVARGPAGTIRFTETGANAIGSINTTTHAITSTSLPSGSEGPVDIVSDSAGTDFFDDYNAVRHVLQIAEITSSGAITTHALQLRSRPGAYPGSTALGRNGAGQTIVYTLDDGNTAVAALNTVTGSVNYFGYARGAGFAQGLTVATDGTVWYTTQRNGGVDRLSPSSRATTVFPTSPATIEPDGIVQAPSGDIWVLDWQRDALYELAAGQCRVSLCLAVAPARG